MGQSLAKVALHIVFSTKNRVPWLKDKSVRGDLYAYMATILKALDSPAIKINGVEDHVHILCLLSRNHAIAEILEEVKKQPSRWIKTKGPAYRGFSWQRGYGVFSVSESMIDAVREYIDDQEEHHKTMSYQDEFRELCRRHGVEIDERYVWD